MQGSEKGLLPATAESPQRDSRAFSTRTNGPEQHSQTRHRPDRSRRGGAAARRRGGAAQVRAHELALKLAVVAGGPSRGNGTSTGRAGGVGGGAEVLRSPSSRLGWAAFACAGVNRRRI